MNGETIMLLFQRQLRLTGGAPAAAWAAEVAAGVNRHSASEVSLWMGAFATPAGNDRRSAPIEALSQVDDLNAATGADTDSAVGHENASSIEAAVDAAMGSEKYLTEVEGGGDFFMPGANQIYAQRIV